MSPGSFPRKGIFGPHHNAIPTSAINTPIITSIFPSALIFILSCHIYSLFVSNSIRLRVQVNGFVCQRYCITRVYNRIKFLLLLYNNFFYWSGGRGGEGRTKRIIFFIFFIKLYKLLLRLNKSFNFI